MPRQNGWNHRSIPTIGGSSTDDLRTIDARPVDDRRAIEVHLMCVQRAPGARPATVAWRD
jgi:hypothetical protein